MSTDALEQTKMEKFSYDDSLVKMFLGATVLWGIVALLLGVTIAFQLAYWKLNLDLPWTTFGRLRPLHTNAAIFAFVGNAIFAGIYYSTQRLCKARLWSHILGRFHFWGWQLIIVAAALTLPLGFTQGKEYAELIWPIDVAIALVWVAFGANFLGTVLKRREKHIYVALWFYIATIVTVAVLHIVNSISLPVDFMQSYPVYAGVQDALVQWWYGHNAVAFFLTTPFLGIMYYFIPKAANRPVYSYRLSIIHFWSLVFIYIWAGPHHLLYSAVPEWVQTTGMVFSVMLWMPSWGGMINGLLTLRGVWDKVRKDPVLKFFATSVTFYGMATFEGPLLSVKSVNYLGHFTDWIVGHVHAGTIGWNYMMIAGMLYYLVPKMYKTELYSNKLANMQFWSATIGLLLYMMSMWVAGITQGLMWRAIDETGKLVYPNFIETVIRIVPMYWVRAIGGTFVLLGFFIMVYNLYKTIKNAPKNVEEDVYLAPVANHAEEPNATAHRKLEGLPVLFTILTTLAILVGGAVEIIPSLVSNKFVEANPDIKPYTSLEIAGRDIYIKEGCYVCHSQHIRPTPEEYLRYGKPSEAADSVYDRPFQWGSRRIGPDLARVGGKYNNMWHYRHMINPRDVTAGSIMPNYPWLVANKTQYDTLTRKLKVMKALGVPYSEEEINNAAENAMKQANVIAKDLSASGVDMSVENKEIVALIAYLQRLGVDSAQKKDDSVAKE
ncbi:cytochrome c oxidase, cbb3-type, subunit I/cytochrome c oxidase, cbb3-type, subunit II multi-domain protein [Bacteriovorax sp. BSW11_IV]|uniref:cytochrome-c oxidase, cbb3-type subunit I n=1 Tax=Bacteriovorax sp. BSW11_IV TaxID=1353529 RepID=UPI00038A0D2A|nr:cytochrome-c oxidase, cbb3-type subunit I [Bacteriovorax sp. BSW11_IV]EQC43081.1 cytochrome c oxidase, cbb3-type, subunit I/cytochrome c oxidase, cbb3-type, subunit II multi-domain protein [Bacteriovorax sp. BSW11_IV]